MTARRAFVDMGTGVPRRLPAGDTLTGASGGASSMLGHVLSSDTTIDDATSATFVQELALSGSTILTLTGTARLMGLG